MGLSFTCARATLFLPSLRPGPRAATDSILSHRIVHSGDTHAVPRPDSGKSRLDHSVASEPDRGLLLAPPSGQSVPSEDREPRAAAPAPRTPRAAEPDSRLSRPSGVRHPPAIVVPAHPQSAAALLSNLPGNSASITWARTRLRMTSPSSRSMLFRISTRRASRPPSSTPYARQNSSSTSGKYQVSSPTRFMVSFSSAVLPATFLLGCSAGKGRGKVRFSPAVAPTTPCSSSGRA